jgi:phosphopantetheinyl transferase
LAIDVFLTPVAPLAADFAAAKTLLPQSRQRKIDRYRQKADKLRSLAAGLLLYWILGVAKDEDLAYGPQGQPRLARPGPFFSLSHAGEAAALAIGPARLGLDLERDRLNLNLDRLAQKILAPAELAQRAKWPNPREFTLAAWTLKESLAKAVGEGLGSDCLAYVALADQKPGPFRGTEWSLGHRLVFGYHAAISSAQRELLRFWRVQSLAANPLAPPLVTPLETKTLWPLAL